MIEIRSDRNEVTEELLHLKKGTEGKKFLVISYEDKYRAAFLPKAEQRYTLLFAGKSGDEEEVKKDICDNYCKYSGDEKAQEEKCADCPLSRLG